MCPTQKERAGDLGLKKPFKAPRPSEKGFVLVTVLLVIALLFPLVLAFNSKVQINLIQAENFRNSVQALRIARSGVEGAIGVLKYDDRTYDSQRDRWGMGFPSLSLGDGILSVGIADEDGKIPINGLVKNLGATSETGQSRAANQGGDQSGSRVVNEEVDKELDARLRNLIQRLGGNPEAVDALIDWIDSNDEVTGTGGAEDGYYKGKGYHCKNGPLDSLDELLLVKGFDRELVIERKLKDYLTIAPTDGKVNLNTSPVEVLQAVLGTQTTGLAQPLSESDIEDLARYREEHELRNTRDILGAVKISQDQLGRISSLVKVNSSYFTVKSKYTIGRVVRNVEALLRRDDSGVRTIDWRES